MGELEELGNLYNGTIIEIKVVDNYAYMTVDIEGVTETITSFTLDDEMSSVVWETFDIDNPLSGKEAEFVLTDVGYRFVRFV